MRLNKLLALASVVLSAGITSVAIATPASADPGGCPSLYVVAIPGTWEPGTVPGAGMLAGVTAPISGGAIRSDYVSYPGTAFPWESAVYGDSKRIAMNGARGMIASMSQACGGTNFALVGYSQGADAAGSLAAEIGHGAGPVPPEKIVGVGLLSDPRRAAGDTLIGPPVDGDGSGGPRIGGFGALQDKTVTICAVGDLFCSTPSAYFIPRIAGLLAESSTANGLRPDQYPAETNALINDVIAHGGLGALANELSDRVAPSRIDEYTSFYENGVHTDYGSYVVDQRGTTAINWLAGWLASKA